MSNLTLPPFLREDIYEILEKCEELGISFAILSNGILINEEVAKKLKKYKHLSYVRVSLDYPTKKDMDIFRGMNGVYEGVENAINVLNSNNIVCGIGMSIMKDNIDKVKDVAELALNYGADFFRAVPIVPIGRASNITLDEEFYKRALNNVLGAHEIVNLDINFSTIILPNNLAKMANSLLVSCPGGDQIIAISHDGKISRCSLSSTYITDRTIRNTSLQELIEINHEKCVNKREKYTIDLTCNNCIDSTKCKGGCMCELEARDGVIENEHPFCFKSIWRSVLEQNMGGKKRRNVVNNIVCRQSTQVRFKIPMCFRSSPVWWFPLKIREVSE